MPQVSFFFFSLFSRLYVSRPWHWLHIFPRLAPDPSFPSVGTDCNFTALGTSYLFSRAWHQLPFSALVTCRSFSGLGTVSKFSLRFPRLRFSRARHQMQFSRASQLLLVFPCFIVFFLNALVSSLIKPVRVRKTKCSSVYQFVISRYFRGNLIEGVVILRRFFQDGHMFFRFHQVSHDYSYVKAENLNYVWFVNSPLLSFSVSENDSLL